MRLKGEKTAAIDPYIFILYRYYTKAKLMKTPRLGASASKKICVLALFERSTQHEWAVATAFFEDFCRPPVADEEK